MSLRHAFSTIGRRASPLFTTSSARAFTLAPAHSTPPSTVYIRRQTRPASNIVGLTPPWQFNDLSHAERRAYERHGPDYLEHMTPQDRAVAARKVATRQERAAQYEAEFGSDWYEILQEATRAKDSEELVWKQALNEELRQLKRSDEKKARKQQYFSKLKDTKMERMKEAMILAAARRRGTA